MELDQITGPNKDGAWKRRISDDAGSGFWWFAETSYHYICPRGLAEHMSFLVKLPSTFLRFRREMRSDTKEPVR